MAQPVTTIPPFADTAQLPSCASSCGPLYDANGACVPPAAQQADGATYIQCFCANAQVSPFATGTSGVCDAACPVEGLSSIANWYRGLCSQNGGDPNQPLPTGSGNTGNGPKNNYGSGGDWISNHWKWVIMLVFLVVGIAGIWIGSCIWRRRYLRKKDRQTTFVDKQSGSASQPSWGPGVQPPPPSGSDLSAASPPGMDPTNGGTVIVPAEAFATTEKNVSQNEKEKEEPNKKKKRKWLVKQRS